MTDIQELHGAPSAGRHAVVVAGVTLTINLSGDRGYELLLQAAGGHLWRPRILWLRSQAIPPSFVARDLRILAPLLGKVTVPGVLTEGEAADALIGMEFIATLDGSGNLVAAEIPGAPTP